MIPVPLIYLAIFGIIVAMIALLVFPKGRPVRDDRVEDDNAYTFVRHAVEHGHNPFAVFTQDGKQVFSPDDYPKEWQLHLMQKAKSEEETQTGAKAIRL
jgi:hypothetical protein